MSTGGVQRLRVAFAGAILDVWYQYPTGPGLTLPARQTFQALPIAPSAA
jgi:hypothetical protein